MKTCDKRGHYTFFFPKFQMNTKVKFLPHFPAVRVFRFLAFNRWRHLLGAFLCLPVLKLALSFPGEQKLPSLNDRNRRKSWKSDEEEAKGENGKFNFSLCWCEKGEKDLQLKRSTALFHEQLKGGWSREGGRKKQKREGGRAF